MSPSNSHRCASTLGRARTFLMALSLAVAGGASACATGPNLSSDYSQTARENYELAQASFDNQDWEDAAAYSRFVRERFPYSRYVREAKLLEARVLYELKEYPSAQDAFRMFMAEHPTHEHVVNGWVPYMVAVSAYMASPSSVPFLPPHFQRDQELLRQTLMELEVFFDRYSGTRMEPLARKLEAEVNRRLLEHELYVARFHLDRDRPEAAIMRLSSAHDRYAGIGLDAEVLFLLGITYLRVGEVELGRQTFTELQMQHPAHHHGEQAKLYLKYMDDRYGPPDPNRPRPDRTPPVPEVPAQSKEGEFKDWRWRKAQRDKKRDAKIEAERESLAPTDAVGTPKPKTKQPEAEAEPETPEPETPETESETEQPEAEPEQPESEVEAQPETEAAQPEAETEQPEAEAEQLESEVEAQPEASEPEAA